jgi:hypothetical protein
MAIFVLSNQIFQEIFLPIIFEIEICERMNSEFFFGFILSLMLPPLIPFNIAYILEMKTVYFNERGTLLALFINTLPLTCLTLILTILFWIPGVIIALFLLFKTKSEITQHRNL